MGLPARKIVKLNSKRIGVNPLMKKTVIIDFPTPPKRPSKKTEKQKNKKLASRKRIADKRRRKEEKQERQRSAERALRLAKSRRKMRKDGRGYASEYIHY